MTALYQTASTSASISDELVSKNDSEKGAISESSIEEIQQRANLTQLLESRGHTVKNKRTNCFLPGHEDQHPSMSVDDEKGWYCHVCQEGGHIIEAIQILDSCNFREAVETLARETHTTIEYERQPQSTAYSKKKVKGFKKKKPQPPQLPEIKFTELAQLPSPGESPESEKLRNGNLRTTYQYSETQKVIRIDYQESVNGKDKLCKPYCLKDGKWENRLGDSQWLPYRSEEILDRAVDKWALWVEGEKCVDMARAISLVATTQVGAGWSLEKIKETLEILKELGIAGIVIWADNDKPGQDKQNKVIEASDSVGLPCIPINPKRLWENIPEKGDIADWIEAHPDMNQEDFIKKLEQEIHQAVSEQEKAVLTAIEAALANSQSPPDTKKKSPKNVADQLAEDYRNKWKYHEDHKTWRSWNGQFWQRIKDGEMDSLIKSTVDARGVEYKDYNFLKNVQKLLQCDLRESYWNYMDRSKFVAFNNYIINLETGETIEHDPGYSFTSVLPYDYRTIESQEEDLLQLLKEKCPHIYHFFEFSQHGDRVKMLRLIAVISALIKWKFHGLQKFIHIMGKPGTGKGTFARLLQKIVGRDNWSGATLKALNNDGSTLAKVIDQQLVVCPDERKTSAIDIILSLTGGDSISYREVYKGAADAFFYGLLVTISNAPIFVGDTTGLARRLILLNFDRQFQERDSQVEELMETELSDLVAVALLMDDKDAKTLLCSQEFDTTQIKWEQNLETNSVAAWLNENVIIDPQTTSLTRELYNDYTEFCSSSGLQKISLTKFPRYLNELASFLNADFKRDTSGRHSQMIGLRLRTEYDDEIPTITSTLQAKSSPPDPNDAPLSPPCRTNDAPLPAIQTEDLSHLHHLNQQTLENSDSKNQIQNSNSTPTPEDPKLNFENQKSGFGEVSEKAPSEPSNPDVAKEEVVQPNSCEVVQETEAPYNFHSLRPGDLIKDYQGNDWKIVEKKSDYIVARRPWRGNLLVERGQIKDGVIQKVEVDDGFEF